MSANLELKKQTVEGIKEKIQKSKSVIFVNYMGLTVEEDTNLRNELRKGGVEYKVLKNTLVKKAFNDLGITDCDAYLEGPTAVAFGYEDEVTAAKIITENVTKLKKISVKAGYVDGAAINENGVKALASLPSKEVLLAKMLGSLQSPITGLAGSLSGIIRKLVYALSGVKDKMAQ